MGALMSLVPAYEVFSRLRAFPNALCCVTRLTSRVDVCVLSPWGCGPCAGSPGGHHGPLQAIWEDESDPPSPRSGFRTSPRLLGVGTWSSQVALHLPTLPNLLS